MDNNLLSIGIIIAGGIGAQWLAWRLKFPSIILLLACGFVAGPVTGLVSPDLLKNELLYAIVGVWVAVILFEGSLRLKVSELKECGVMIGRLLTVGAAVTWVLCTAAGVFVLGLQLEAAVMLGAILIVTGPTVIQPMLKHIRPTGRLGPILKWEGIAIDSVGALAAVLVYEFIASDGFRAAMGTVGWGVLSTLFMATVVGVLAAFFLIIAVRYFWVPDALHNAFALMVVVSAFVGMSIVHNEPTGFLTVTIMGIVLANQNFISIRNILKFKEDLRTLLLPSLFIILAARIPMADLKYLDVRTVAFVALLILVIRPLSVFVSAWGVNMSWREQVFISGLAPRGVVAAVVSSIFAARMAAEGYPDADRLVVITFFVIVCTVVIYGFSSPVLAHALGVSGRKANGILFLGAHDWACRMAAALAKAGVPVLLIDSNGEHVRRGRRLGLPVVQGSFLNEDTLEQVNLTSIGTVLALTPNNEANSLGLMHLSEEFEKNRLYQLADRNNEVDAMGRKQFHGRILFNSGVNFHALDELFEHGARVRAVEVGNGFDLNAAHPGALALFAVDPVSKSVAVASTDAPLSFKSGHICIIAHRHAEKAGQ